MDEPAPPPGRRPGRPPGRDAADGMAGEGAAGGPIGDGSIGPAGDGAAAPDTLDAADGSEPGTTPPGAVRRVLRWVAGVELAFGAVTVLAILGLVLVQAGQRYLPVEGWSWTGELARFSLVWLTFALAGVLVTSDSHIAIEMVDGIRRPSVVRSVRVAACLVVALVGAGLFVEAWQLTFDQPPIKSPAMGMPMSWLYAPLVAGFASTVVRAVVAAYAFARYGVPERADDAETTGVTGA